MENLKKYVRSHTNHVFLLMVTAILCVTSGIVFHHWPEYVVVGNMLIGLVFLFWIWQALYRGGDYRKDFLLKMVCTAAMLIASNRLFTMEAWIASFPFMKGVEPTLLFFVGLLGVLLAMGLYKLLPHYKQKIGAGKKPSAGENGRQEDGAPHGTATDAAQVTGGSGEPSRRRFGPYLFCGIGVLLLMAVIVIVFVLSKNGISAWLFSRDSLKNIVYAIVELVLIAGAAVVILSAIISAIIYLGNTLRNWVDRKTLQKDDYRVISMSIAGIILVLAVVFLPEITIETFRSEMISGKWLAGAAYLLAFAVLFGFLTVAIYILIILISDMQVQDIKKKLQEGKLGKYIGQVSEIIRDFFDVILGTIGGALKFALFVPGFLKYMQKMIEGDDQDESKNGEE